MANESKTEERNRRKGFIFSVVTHTVLIALLAIFGLSWQSPPPEPGGITVNLGIPDVGQGNENAPKGDPAPPVEDTKPEPEETPPPPKEESKPEPVKETKPDPTPQKEVKKTEDPNAEAIRKKKEEERKRKAAEAEAERKRKAAEAEAERKRKAEEAAAAAKKAEEERKRKELEALVSGGLGGGSGDGKGNTGNPGNQGNPDGDPNSNVLSGMGAGDNISGNLRGRGVAYKPGNFSHKCPQTGKMVIRICVDKNGSVTKAEFTLNGSEVSATCNKNAAISHAKKYRFGKGSKTDCGTITYNFTVK
ncbi:MAG: cell envelope integrity protein TolA [Bacteroidota bacterium]